MPADGAAPMSGAAASSSRPAAGDAAGRGAFESFVLYVGPDAVDPRIFCPGSRSCIPLAEQLGDINIQNVRTLLDEGVRLPGWLTGTPMLVDMENRQAHKGTDALNHLKRLCGSRDGAKERPPSHDEMNGVLPAGEAHLHGDGGLEAAFAAPANAHGESSRFSDEKITEESLQRYMEARNGNRPAAAGGPAPGATASP